MRELGSRERSQPAPPHAVWASLTDPRRSGARPWLELLADEVEPQVIEAVEPNRVVWSSLWPDRPHDRILFDLRVADDGCSCALRWSLLTPDDPPGDSKLGHLRYRLNLLINDRLRRSEQAVRAVVELRDAQPQQFGKLPVDAQLGLPPEGASTQGSELSEPGVRAGVDPACREVSIHYARDVELTARIVTANRVRKLPSVGPARSRGDDDARADPAVEPQRCR